MDNLPYNTQTSSVEIINNSYAKIAEYFDKTEQLKKEQQQLANQETLFDLERTIYKEIKDCSIELISLKKMWDLISLIDLQFDNWKNTLWAQIDTDLL